MKRALFTLRQYVSHRQTLRHFLSKATQSCATILEVTPALLEQQKVAILVLDFDGVMAAHNGPVLLPEVFSWLTNLLAAWNKPIYIFSNKPLPEREAYFKTHFPQVGFIKNVARKPYPEGLIQLAQHTKVESQQILIVDDRLLTGILAAVLAGTQALWIRKPYQDFRRHPVKESVFHLLRFIDRCLCR